MAKRRENVSGAPRMVFSSDQAHTFDSRGEMEDITLPPAQQDLRVWLDRGRGGKSATVLRGFVGSAADLKELGRALQAYCSVGGSVKEGEAVLQGDHRDRVLAWLVAHGYKAKKAGG